MSPLEDTWPLRPDGEGFSVDTGVETQACSAEKRHNVTPVLKRRVWLIALCHEVTL